MFAPITTAFPSCPPTPYGLPPRALRGSVIHVFLVSIVENLILSGYRTELTIVVLDLVMPLITYCN